MLVLTRGINEKIIIGEGREIEITLVSINGQKARIGIVAPKDIPVDSEEVIDRKIAGGYQAAAG